MSNSIGECFPGDKETPAFEENDRDNRFRPKHALRTPGAKSLLPDSPTKHIKANLLSTRWCPQVFDGDGKP